MKFLPEIPPLRYYNLPLDLVKELCWIKREETISRCYPFFRVGSPPVLHRHFYWRIVLIVTPTTLMISTHFALKGWSLLLSLHWIQPEMDDNHSFLFLLALTKCKKCTVPWSIWRKTSSKLHSLLDSPWCSVQGSQ